MKIRTLLKQNNAVEVIYRDNECLGGSVIRDRISENYYKWAENRGYNYEVYG